MALVPWCTVTVLWQQRNLSFGIQLSLYYLIMNNLDIFTFKSFGHLTLFRVCTLLESPWKLQSVLESPWISVLPLSKPDSRVAKLRRSKHRLKGLQDEIAHVVQEQKIKTQGSFFALNGVLEKWEMCSWKVLEFFVQKRVRTLIILQSY